VKIGMPPQAVPIIFNFSCKSIQQLTQIPQNSAHTTTHGQTGPRTEAVKAQSCRNAIRIGLYAARDFIRPEGKKNTSKPSSN
jgi:hypothetical protein